MHNTLFFYIVLILRIHFKDLYLKNKRFREYIIINVIVFIIHKYI